MKIIFWFIIIFANQFSLGYAQESGEFEITSDIPVKITDARKIIFGEPFVSEGYIKKEGNTFYLSSSVSLNDPKKIEILIDESNKSIKNLGENSKLHMFLRHKVGTQGKFEVLRARVIRDFYEEELIDSMIGVIGLTQKLVFEKADAAKFDDYIRINLLSDYSNYKKRYPDLFAIAERRLKEIQNIEDPFIKRAPQVRGQ